MPLSSVRFKYLIAGLVTATVVLGAGTAGERVVIPHPSPPQNQVLYWLDADAGRWAVGLEGDRLGIGTLGNPVEDTGVAYRASVSGRLPKDLSGERFRWAEAGDGAFVLRSVDLSTGAETSREVGYRPLAWTPNGWIGVLGNQLVRHLDGQPDEVILSGFVQEFPGYLPEVRADDTGALVRYQDATAERLVLIEGGQTRELAVSSADPIGGEHLRALTLTPNSVVWSTVTWPELRVGHVHRQARSGGAVSRYQSEPVAGLAATDDAIAISSNQRQLINTSPRYLYRVYAHDGTAWRPITLPDSYPGYTGNDLLYGLGTDGSRFLAALGASNGNDAAVYGFDTGDATVVSTVPTEHPTVEDVVLNQGWHFTIGNAEVYRRKVSSALELGPLQRLSMPVQPGPGAISVSGPYVLRRDVVDEQSRFVLIEFPNFDNKPRILQGQALEGGPGATISGSYFLADHDVYRVDQPSDAQPLASLDAVDADLYGSRVVWSTPQGAVQVHELGRPSLGARTLLASGAAGPVAIYGNSVAWARSGGRITVVDQNTEKRRQVKISKDVKWIGLGESTLAWADQDDEVWVLNLRAGDSQPVKTGLGTPVALDAHQIAGSAGNGRTAVEPLPYGQDQKYRPRLISAQTPSAVNPGEAPWSPQFDFTADVTDAQLKIFRNGQLVRTLPGESVYGRVRILWWHGDYSDGRPAPAGNYTWTFSAESTTGQGSAVGIDGKSVVAGSLRLTR
ncbi:hypothetical protein [Kineosporia babensis]|uniref:FlgD Ig-like domain-containing protein n=1 Tax=Kineosporia babensis TaxID=499548 RepID=A0A9X1NET0_9ACTN|nr:hypothetical protein [Kineosporia babensis]MCD5312803.1 hypothetical protein [Kineosporia babensis]